MARSIKRQTRLRRAFAPIAAACIASVVFLSLTLPTSADNAARPWIDVMRPSAARPAIPMDENEASTQKPGMSAGHSDAREALCLIVEAAAKANDLPLAFFARVIWQESHFQSDAVGPVTRNGQRAQGIAQFMPGTASERRLLDPFDPVQALPKSAEFLAELHIQFGNLGLAAAAYNAGPKRVRDWLAGSGYMPLETRNYVSTITGVSVDDWAKVGRNGPPSDSAQTSNCRELIAVLERSPNVFVIQLEHRVRLAATKRWGVQVAAGFNRDNALAMYARAMKGLNGAIIDQSDPLLFRSRGTSSFYQVRIGSDTRREADNLCSRIRRSGGSCLVKRNVGATSTTVPADKSAG